jgi:predicted heme/steroid binding protein
MERMSEAPQQHDSPADQPQPARFRWLRTLHASATRRALLLTALGGLLIAGLITALPIDGEGPGSLATHTAPVPSTATKGNDAFNHAVRGNCLMWPPGLPEAATIVDCKDEHRFEVAESVDMRAFPGSEYGPDAAPPSAARIEQISQEQCESAVRRYLGDRFDPSSKFTISMLWSGDKAWRQAGERRMLCGLELPGLNNEPQAFKGRVADINQSRVWPDGTCLGVDPSTNQPTDIPVNCAAPHAMEVTGTVNLAAQFPDGWPPEPEQDKFIKDACTRLTDAYLAPVQLRSTTLTLVYSALSLPSWSAGSREVACSIGATLGNGGWATLVNSAKGPLLINGQPPVPPPEIPLERLNLPSIFPMPPANPGGSASSSAPGTSRPPGTPGTSGSPGSGGQRLGNQHLPGQPAAPTSQPPPAAPQPPPPPEGLPPSPPAEPPPLPPAEPVPQPAPPESEA